MKPFTAIKYFMENKRKGLVCFIVLIFTVSAVALITALVNSIPETAYDTSLKPLLYYSGVYTSMDQPMDASTIKALEDLNATERLVSAQYNHTSMDLAIGGNTSATVIFMSYENIAYTLGKIKDELKEGRLPEEGKDEIVVHWRIMKNKGWNIGDLVGREVDSNEWFQGKYEIVGILDGPSIIATGIRENAGMDEESNPYFYLAFFKEGQRSEFNDYLATIDTHGVSTFYFEETKASIDDSLDSLNSTLLVIIIVVVLILSISVSALMYIIYLQRLDEFGILYALGYKRKFVRNMIIKEILTLNIVGWIFGLIFSILVVFVLNTLLYYPKGNIVNVYNIKVLYYTVIIPIMVGVASIFPITKKLKKCDPIAIIERRD